MASLCGCIVTVNLSQRDLEKRNASTLLGYPVQDARPYVPGTLQQ